MSDFIEYKPMDVEHNIKAAVENLRKAYWSNDAEKVAKIFTEAETIIVSAICHDNYTVCKPYEERPQGDLISRSELKKAVEPYKYAICGFEGILAIIDNAPPVPDRPQGKWVKTGNMTKRSYQRVCDNCHNIVYFCGKGNYPNCPYCLAEMKGGETECHGKQ